MKFWEEIDSMLVTQGYEEYVKHFQYITEEWINMMHTIWEKVELLLKLWWIIIYIVVKCVASDCRIAAEALKTKLLDSRNHEMAVAILHRLVQESLTHQLVVIFIFILVPTFAVASIYVFFCPRHREEEEEDAEINEGTSFSSELKENIGFPSSEKANIVQSTIQQSDRDREELPVTPTTPTAAPQMPGVAPPKNPSPRSLQRHFESLGTPTAAVSSPHKDPFTPSRTTAGPSDNTNLSPRSKASLVAPPHCNLHSSPGDEERSVDCTEYTDLEVDSKLGDDQDLAYVLRRCIMYPRALVGWRIMLPNVHKGAVGVVLSTVKRPFNATKFLIEMQDGSVEQFALQRSARKLGEPFTLLEKAQ